VRAVLRGLAEDRRRSHRRPSHRLS
jgi:hypothetical protein